MSVQVKQFKRASQCFVQWIMRDNFKSSELLTADRVPDIMREQFVYTGYRPVYRSWKYYVHSILHLHNETVNIWTHIIGSFAIVIQLANVLKDCDVANDSTTSPVITLGICSILSLSFSSIAHLLHSKSPWHHQFLFLLDYVGVAVQGFGIGIGSIYICSSAIFRDVFLAWHLPANLILSVLIFSLYCTARVKYGDDNDTRKSLMIVGTSLHGLFLFAPLVPRYTECWWNSDCSMTSLNHITLVVFLDVLCAVAFAALIPERWVPGRCDLVGHSHQIFHVAVVMTLVAKLSAMRIDIDTLDIPRKTIPSLTTLLGSLCLLLLLHALVHRYFLSFVKSAPSRKRGRIK